MNEATNPVYSDHYFTLPFDEQEGVCIFLQLPFHPNDPPSQALQQLFRDTLLLPPH
jgi:hypothetical protein